MLAAKNLSGKKNIATDEMSLLRTEIGYDTGKPIDVEVTVFFKDDDVNPRTLDDSEVAVPDEDTDDYPKPPRT